MDGAAYFMKLSAHAYCSLDFTMHNYYLWCHEMPMKLVHEMSKLQWFQCMKFTWNFMEYSWGFHKFVSGSECVYSFLLATHLDTYSLSYQLMSTSEHKYNSLFNIHAPILMHLTYIGSWKFVTVVFCDLCMKLMDVTGFDSIDSLCFVY